MRLRDGHMHWGDPALLRPIAQQSPLRSEYPCYRTVQFARMNPQPALQLKPDVEAVTLVPFVFAELDMGRENRVLLEAARGDLRFFPFALLDQRNPQWLEQNAGHLAGLKEHIVLHESTLTRGKRPLLETAQRRGLTLLLHTDAQRRIPYVLELVREYPRLSIQVAHLGRSGDGRDLSFIARVLTALAPCETVFFDTSTVRSPEALELAVKLVGAQRVLFGSDFPFFMDEDGREDIVEAQIQQVERARLSWGEREAILFGNHQRLIQKGTSL